MMMLKELFSLFSSEAPLQAVGKNFTEMLNLSLDLVRRGGAILLSGTATPDERTNLQKQDVKVNKLERRIRKQVIVHLSMPENSPDLPYCVLMISLVKDVERIGDYAKDLADLVRLDGASLPENQLVAELQELRAGIEADYASAVAVFESMDRESAIDLISCGRDTVERCEQLIDKIAACDCNAATASKLVLAARFYQRIAGHVLNILSSVVMPLHKLDYYDEKDIAKAQKRDQP